ncbi:MAG: hypothetical protein WA208_13650 [Thermoanaerobaculia bacterium]
MTKLDVTYSAPRFEDGASGVMLGGRQKLGANELEALCEAYLERGGDLSPVLAKIAEHIVSSVKSRIRTRGYGTWVPLSEATYKRDKYPDRKGRNRPGSRSRTGPGMMRGNLINSIVRDWSKSNAVALSLAPHTHLLDRGVKQYAEGPRWQQKQVGPDGTRRVRRFSKGQSRAPRTDASVHSPARVFMVISDAAIDNAYIPAVLTFVVEGRVALPGMGQ